MRLILWLVLIWSVVAPPAMAEALAPPPGMKLERVVLLMRHGVRPPTKAVVTPPGIASDAWPAWDTPWGQLTAHGAKAIVLLARSDRAAWSRSGLFSARGCPVAGAVEIWADTDQRTIATGEAFGEGFAPGCGLTSGHLPQGRTDMLFSPLDAPAAMDATAALAAVHERIGDPNAYLRTQAVSLDLAQRVLNCCSAKACADAGLPSGCRVGDMPSAIVMSPDEGAPKATGPLDYLPTAAQSIMLAYVEGKPMNQVGWGRVSARDIEQLMSLHVAKGDALQRPSYIATRGAAPLMRRMLQALEDPSGAKLVVLVGHDTNIVHLAGALDLHWRVPEYPADNPPPGAGLGMELFSDAKGDRFVRVFYRSQTMSQMRGLTRLEAEHDAYRAALDVPLCKRSVGGLCPLSDFAALLARP